MKQMLPAGYLYKSVASHPDWGNFPDLVVDLYSVSSCISNDFADYITQWQHNGFWLFDAPDTMVEIAKKELLDLSAMQLFYYEIYENEFDAAEEIWRSFKHSDFKTNVVAPGQKHFEGFDVATYSCGNMQECSPLSCNGLASKFAVNAHCLFKTFDEAKLAAESDEFANAEPGPFRILAVYTV